MPNLIAKNLMNRLRMKQITLLLNIQEFKTLGAAAEKMNLSQPAATKMLHELEQALNLTLFDRIGRGLKITAAGERIANYFVNLQGNIEALSNELPDLRLGLGVRLKIGSIMVASPKWLTYAVWQLKQQLPKITLEITIDTSNKLLEQMQQGLIEMLIGRLPLNQQQNDNYIFRKLNDVETLSLIVSNSHPLLTFKKVRFEDLLAFNWVLQPRGSPMRAMLEQEFNAHNVNLPSAIIETSSILTSMDLVRCSDFIAVIPQVVASDYVKHNMIKILDYSMSFNLNPYGTLIQQDRPLSFAASKLLNILHNQEQC